MEIRLVRISFTGTKSYWVSSRMSKGMSIAQVSQLTNGRWARWKFCVPWNKTAILYAGYLWKITLNPTLNSCWKPKREAVSKSYWVKPYWLPVSRGSMSGTGASKREWEKAFRFWSRVLGVKLWEQAGLSREVLSRSIQQCCRAVCNRATVEPSQSTVPVNLGRNWTV